MTTAKWILEAYEKAGDEQRMEMYMLYRDLREDFEQMDTCRQVLEAKNPSAAAEPAPKRRLKWHGRLRKVFGST